MAAWRRLHHNLVWPFLPLAWTPFLVFAVSFVRPDWHAVSWLLVGYVVLGFLGCAALAVATISRFGIFVGQAGLRIRTDRHADTIAWRQIDRAEIAMVPTPGGPFVGLVLVGPAGEVRLLPVRMGVVNQPWGRGRRQQLRFTRRTLTRIAARINELAARHAGVGERAAGPPLWTGAAGD